MTSFSIAYILVFIRLDQRSASIFLRSSDFNRPCCRYFIYIKKFVFITTKMTNWFLIWINLHCFLCYLKVDIYKKSERWLTLRAIRIIKEILWNCIIWEIDMEVFLFRQITKKTDWLEWCTTVGFLRRVYSGFMLNMIVNTSFYNINNIYFWYNIHM